MKRRKIFNPLEQFSSGCKCLLHEQWYDENETKPPLKIDTYRKFKKTVINDLRIKNLLPERGNILCRSCYNTFSSKYGHDHQLDFSQTINETSCDDQAPVEGQIKDPFDALNESLQIVIQNLETKPFEELYNGNENLWIKLFELLGSSISSQVYNDGKSLEAVYKQPKFLIDLNILSFIKKRNILLVKFLCGLSHRKLESESKSVVYTFACTIEMCYNLRNMNLVLPNSFLANLVQSCISGSKSVSVVNGKITPGGGYTTYRNWIQLQGEKMLTCMKGTLDIFFDNIGKYIIKSYRVSSDSSARADVITTAIQILPTNEYDIQQDASLKPKRKSTDRKTLHQKMESEIEKGVKNYREYRYRFLHSILSEFLNHMTEDWL